jgi:cytochrome c biogenesis protein CcmG/thiol:disulfide interchange protein DsbE
MGKWLAMVFIMAFTGVAIADIAPDFSLQGQGGQVSLADYKGKVVLVDFWASWCGPCRQSFPWMNSMLEKYRAQGLEILAINLDQDQEEGKRFLVGNTAAFDVAFDPQGKTPELFSVMGMPSSFLIDSSGNIIVRHVGFHQNRVLDYENNLRAGLGLSPLGN